MKIRKFIHRNDLSYFEGWGGGRKSNKKHRKTRRKLLKSASNKEKADYLKFIAN